ncbi:MAG TPA: glycosyltransferase family 4 protein [Azospirillum sp.]
MVHRPGVLIIVENLPVPLDRRVWQEAHALHRHGWEVSVICPKAHGYTRGYEVIDGIHVHRHGLPFEATGKLGFVLEYAAALVGEFALACRIKATRGFDVIQACNPPDDIFLVAGGFKLLFGTRFIFDHHDPVPEMFLAKFGREGWLYRATLLAERWTLRLADHVVTTSEALRRIAVERGGRAPEEVTLVRSGLDLDHVPTVAPDPALKRGAAHLLLYVGVMGAQDGVDRLLRALRVLIARGRTDVHLALAGAGPEFEPMRALARELGVDGHCTFHGYVTGRPFFELLATADLGVCPDPPNAYNDKISMNKLMEYMAFRLPVVQFGLTEDCAIAGGAGLAASGSDPADLADRIAELLDDPERRRRMGDIGRERVERLFDWRRQMHAYLQVYDTVLAGRPAVAAR